MVAQIYMKMVMANVSLMKMLTKIQTMIIGKIAVLMDYVMKMRLAIME